jgi:hypothetical protein
MPKSSLQLIAACQQQGLISKEASADLLRQRDQLIKQAMKKHAGNFFKSLKALGGKASKGGRELPTAAPKGNSFLAKFRHAGRTPAKTIDDMGKAVPAGRPEWSDVAANLGKMMALAGMTAGATAGIGGLLRNSKDKKLKREIDISYKQMFKEHPRLKDLEEDDPGRVRRHFGVLARYAPSLAADPTVAGSWVSATAQLGQVGASDIKNLAETQARIDESREDRGSMKMAPLKMSELAAKSMMFGG